MIVISPVSFLLLLLLLLGLLSLLGLALLLLLGVDLVEVLRLGDDDLDLVGAGAAGALVLTAAGVDLGDGDELLVLQHLDDGDGIGDGGVEGGEDDLLLAVVEEVLGQVGVDELAALAAHANVVLGALGGGGRLLVGGGGGGHFGNRTVKGGVKL